MLLRLRSEKDGWEEVDYESQWHATWVIAVNRPPPTLEMVRGGKSGRKWILNGCLIWPGDWVTHTPPLWRRRMSHRIFCVPLPHLSDDCWRGAMDQTRSTVASETSIISWRCLYEDKWTLPAPLFVYWLYDQLTVPVREREGERERRVVHTWQFSFSVHLLRTIMYNLSTMWVKLMMAEWSQWYSSRQVACERASLINIFDDSGDLHSLTIVCNTRHSH